MKLTSLKMLSPEMSANPNASTVTTAMTLSKTFHPTWNHENDWKSYFPFVVMVTSIKNRNSNLEEEVGTHGQKF